MTTPTTKPAGSTALAMYDAQIDYLAKTQPDCIEIYRLVSLRNGVARRYGFELRANPNDGETGYYPWCESA